MKNKEERNINIPEELSIPKFKERYSKMVIPEASSTLLTEIGSLKSEFSLMKHTNPYFNATNKLLQFMKEFSYLMHQCHRPATANDLRYDELKSLLYQICENSKCQMPKIEGDEEDN